DLTGIVFAQAKLRAARFDKARLSLSNLARIDATGASFAEADLKGADLTGAILRRADFREADLRVQTAILPDGSTRDWPVRLSFIKPQEADFTNALIDRLLMEGVDLTGIKADPLTFKKLAELPG
ncbi:MAG TPA: pentapeptide repeat-containing protein, partial [Alphaproteobacteria bacterium]|nr:pentapeptide repeat-containing protein [Alphaproteobacteria bacterium]